MKITKELLTKELKDKLTDGDVADIIGKFEFEVEDEKKNINQAVDLKGDKNDFSSSELRENEAKLAKEGQTSANQGILVKGSENKGTGIKIIGNKIDEQDKEVKNYAIIIAKEDIEKFFILVVDYKIDKKGKVSVDWTSRYPSNDWKGEFYSTEDDAESAIELPKETMLEEKDYHIDSDLNDNKKRQIQRGFEKELGIKAVNSVTYLTNKVQIVAKVEIK